MKKSTSPGGSRKRSLKGSVENCPLTRLNWQGLRSLPDCAVQMSCGSRGKVSIWVHDEYPSVRATQKQERQLASRLVLMLWQFLDDNQEFTENLSLPIIRDKRPLEA